MRGPKLFILLLILSCRAAAQNMEAAFPLIDSLYKSYAEKEHIPGLVYGIVANGRLVHTGTFGYQDAVKKTPATVHSVYRIASMTKSFTAMAILSLRDAGKLRLDDPVSQYIPEMKKIHPLTDDSPPITIRHLLSHSAGFPEDNPWGDRQLQRTDEELIRFIAGGVSLSNTPGLAYEYSNLGFTLLGHIVSKVSGEPFEQYIRRTIFKPLGMEHTYWEYTEVKPEELAHGYRWLNDQWKEEELLHSGAYGAMGGMLTSLEDFSRYMAFHLSAWPPRNGEEAGPIRRSSVREMHQPGKISGFFTQNKNAAGEICPRVSAYNFGLGWNRDCTGKEWVGHSGGLPGFGSHWMILPEYGIGVVSFCNLTYEATSTLNAQVMERLINIARLKPRQLPASAILRQRQQQLMALLPDWKEAPASGIFSENFFDDYLIDSLRKEAKTLFVKIGKVLRVEEIVPDNQLRGTFRVVGEKGDLQVRFTLSPENPALIQAYFIREAVPAIGGRSDGSHRGAKSGQSDTASAGTITGNRGETAPPRTKPTTFRTDTTNSRTDTTTSRTDTAPAKTNTTTSRTSKYGLKTISSIATYRQMVAADPRQSIIPLDKFIPGLLLDIRYATANNIMHRPMYHTAAAFLRLPAAEALKAIQEELKPLGYALKIYDGYRPYQVTVDFYEAYHDSNFVASPYTGSRHNRGCAVDLTLIDLKTNKELDMPTPYDDFTPQAAANYASVTAKARKNRQLLQDVMLKHGFVIYPSEWWHFDFEGWKAYPVMDLSFEDLLRQ